MVSAPADANTARTLVNVVFAALVPPNFKTNAPPLVFWHRIKTGTDTDRNVRFRVIAAVIDKLTVTPTAPEQLTVWFVDTDPRLVATLDNAPAGSEPDVCSIAARPFGVIN